MSGIPSTRRHELSTSEGWWLGALAVALVGALFALQGRLGFNLADEGFLWYGAQQTARGAVPMRDFYAYDPGRYYWAAVFMRGLGDGIVALRIANAAFQVLGLWCGLLVVRRVVRPRWALVSFAVLALLWMYPRHKLYESSLAMIAAWVGCRLLERPTLARHAEAGAFVGLAAFFGKNHALYAACAFALLLALRFWKDRESVGTLARRLGAFALGGLCGGLPLLGMFVATPGFSRAYFQILRYFSAAGQTNLSTPFPWPWRVLAEPTAWSERVLKLATGLALLLLPFVYLPALRTAWRARQEDLERLGVPLAASAVGLFYMHHAWARTDSFHLAQAIHPALLVVVAAVANGERMRRAALVAALVAFTLLGAIPEMPLVARLTPDSPASAFVSARVGRDEILLPARSAQMITSLREILARESPDGPVLIAPHLPGLYPALARTAPVWDIYPIWPAAGERDRRMLGELKQQGVVLAVLDGYLSTEESPWEKNYPETAAYLAGRFLPVATPGLPKKIVLWKRSSAAD